MGICLKKKLMGTKKRKKTQVMDKVILRLNLS
jgi:hypothetical protein